jgi:hypothetical protein
MPTHQRRRYGVRYSPFRSIPTPILLLTAVVGICGGIYIFDDIVRDGVEKATSERENAASVKPKSSGSTGQRL